MAITFDTLQLVNQLEAAGIERTQAVAFVDIVKQATDSSEIATKGDIALIRSELRESELRLRTELVVMKWMLGFIFAGIATLIAKTFF